MVRSDESQSTERSWPREVRPFLIDGVLVVFSYRTDQLPERVRSTIDVNMAGLLDWDVLDVIDIDTFDWQIDPSLPQALVIASVEAPGETPDALEYTQSLLATARGEVPAVPGEFLIRLILPSSAGEQIVEAFRAAHQSSEVDGAIVVRRGSRLVSIRHVDQYVLLDQIRTRHEDAAAMSLLPSAAPNGEPAGHPPRADAILSLSADSFLAWRALSASMFNEIAGYLSSTLRDAAQWEAIRGEPLVPEEAAFEWYGVYASAQGALDYLGEEQPWVAEWLPEGLQIVIPRRFVPGVDTPQLGLPLDWPAAAYSGRVRPGYLVQCTQAYRERPRSSACPATDALSFDRIDDEFLQMGHFSWAAWAPTILRAYDSACREALIRPPDREFVDRSSAVQVATLGVAGTIPESAVILSPEVAPGLVQELTRNPRARPTALLGHTVIGLDLLDEVERRGRIYALAPDGLGGLVLDLSVSRWPESKVAAVLRAIVGGERVYFHISSLEGGTRITVSGLAAPPLPI